jgi:hypothetical protein
MNIPPLLLASLSLSLSLSPHFSLSLFLFLPPSFIRLSHTQSLSDWLYQAAAESFLSYSCTFWKVYQLYE